MKNKSETKNNFTIQNRKLVKKEMIKQQIDYCIKISSISCTELVWKNQIKSLCILYIKKQSINKMILILNVQLIRKKIKRINNKKYQKNRFYIINLLTNSIIYQSKIIQKNINMQKYPIKKMSQNRSFSTIQIHELLSQWIQDRYINCTFFHQINSKFKLQQISRQQAVAIYSNLQEKNISQNLNSKKNWKSQQLNLLVFLIEKYCSINSINKVNHLQNWQWQQFSFFLPGRTGDDCKFKILSLTAQTITSDPWTQEEKNILTQLIQEQGINWNKISQTLFQKSSRKVFRTSKQCRQHYMCFLKPNLKKGVWTQEQDYKLICLFLQFGKKWSKIMKSLQGRNQNSIKNRFFLLFQNKSRAINNSDLIKKVKRKKEKLQKTIQKIDQIQWKQKITLNPKSNFSLKTEKLENQKKFLIKPLKQILEAKKETLNYQEIKKSLEEYGQSTEENLLNQAQKNQMQIQDEVNTLSCQNRENASFSEYNSNFLGHNLTSQQLIFQSFQQYISF